MLSEVNSGDSHANAGKDNQWEGYRVENCDDAAESGYRGGVGAGERGVILHELAENVGFDYFYVRAHSLDKEFGALCCHLSEENSPQHVRPGDRRQENHQKKANAND